VAVCGSVPSCSGFSTVCLDGPRIKTIDFLISQMSSLFLLVFLLLQALRSFCLAAKRTKKSKAHPNPSGRWAGSAAVALSER
jgi:hypothetical protein